MSLNPEDKKSVEAIRARAQELATGEQNLGTRHAEVVAAIADGTLSFEYIPDGPLQCCVEEFGADSVVDALTAGAGPAAPMKSPDTSIPIARGLPIFSAMAAWWRRTVAGIAFLWDRPLVPAAAAALAVLAAGVGTLLVYERLAAVHESSGPVLTADNRVARPAPVPQGANGQIATTVPTVGRSPTTSPASTSKRAATRAAGASQNAGAATVSHGSATIISADHPTNGTSNSAPSRPAAPAKGPPVPIDPSQPPAEHLAKTTDDKPDSASHSTATTSPPPASSGKLFFIHPPAAGGKTFGTNAGARAMPAAKGQTTVQTKSGGTVTKRADGRVATVHDTGGIEVHYGLSGGRRVVVERSNHARVVVEPEGHGYVQSAYMYHGHEYAQRSYYYQGHYNHAYYGRYDYDGVFVSPYFPTYYHSPAYYGWAYNPWAAPVSYDWEWRADPWCGYYRTYFRPHRAYDSASLWLTDYIIGNSLRVAYRGRLNVQAAALSSPSPLTPEVEDLIANEVRAQIALENSEAKGARANADPDLASSSIQRLLTDGKPHIFVTGGDLDVFDTLSTECALSSGDALQLIGQSLLNAQTATLAILASKGGKECPKGDTVSVALQDLQEMQNYMRETIDQGLQELQKKQGQGGLPAAPAAAQAAPVENPLAAAAPPPPPENEVVAQITQQSREAEQVEKALLAGTAPSSGLDAGTLAAPAAEQSPPAQAAAGGRTGVAAAEGGRAVTAGSGSTHRPVKSSKPAHRPPNQSISKTTKPQKK